MSFNKLCKVLGLDRETVKRAAKRGGAKTDKVPSPFRNVDPAQVVRVGEFPKILEGFQKTGLRPDGHHFHPWAVDAKKGRNGEILVTAKNGTVLTFEP